MELQTCNDFEKIVIDEIPLIDVRAPIEFEKGAFINAVNLPLMNDEERRLVGICYKEKGNEEAVKLGHQLVKGEIKQARINSWKTQIEQHPNGRLYCFRGGLRSQISQQWIAEATGYEISRLEGGYKAFRNYLMGALEPSQQKSKPVLVGGCTGAGKTNVLKRLENAIDLEGLANHRGSSFGKKLTPQPSQINFENNLAYALIQHNHKAFRYMILEDEGRNVGRNVLPKPLVEYFSTGDFVVVEASLEERIHNTLQEYVIEDQKNYQKAFPHDEGLSQWAAAIVGSLGRIKNRLGGDRYQQVMNLFDQAYQEQVHTENINRHKDWIETLLRDYYDPMYQYQIQKNPSKVIFQGTVEQVLEFLKYNYA